jgi:putative oxidoreductase
MEKQLTGWLPALGRLLITALFLPSGIMKLASYAGTMGYISSHSLPLPQVAYVIAVLVEVPVVILFFLGWQTRIMAAILGIYTIAAALFFHNNLADMGQAINFWKNLAIAGGLCSFVAYGAGTWSIDHWRSKR